LHATQSVNYFTPQPCPKKSSDMKRQEHFWNVDLRVLFKEWLSQLWTFFLTLLTFLGIGLPVLISIFVLWYLAGFPRIGMSF
jgi:hypothetical protein